MKKKNDEPKVKTYIIKCTEIEILIIYRMMVLRISKHFSGAEVSFLMGKPLDYIDKIETFKLKKVLALDLYIFSLALDFENGGCAYPVFMGTDNEENRYEMVVSTYKEHVIYELRQVDLNNVVVKPIFILIDNNYTLERVYTSTAAEIEKLKNVVRELFKEKFFQEERTAYDIRYACQEKLGSSVEPKKLITILESYLSGKEDFSLTQRKSTKMNFNGFVYVETK
ncbi:hypothetical protein [Sphingobacterium faecale]|uniref:Uncharacterized protein n=1 Tax=Sphingobacterium faecale TaxID=2803775 RepID=A0ABS1R0D0_9SPHI|nr:hypothetical protein [Sphingobacterium faecale]MBL1407925.1 hypothetical protein [Sphingobacterium faecale]